MELPNALQLRNVVQIRNAVQIQKVVQSAFLVSSWNQMNGIPCFLLIWFKQNYVKSCLMVFGFEEIFQITNCTTFGAFLHQNNEFWFIFVPNVVHLVTRCPQTCLHIKFSPSRARFVEHTHLRS
jgi:hypothetical protein